MQYAVQTGSVYEVDIGIGGRAVIKSLNHWVFCININTILILYW